MLSAPSSGRGAPTGQQLTSAFLGGYLRSNVFIQLFGGHEQSPANCHWHCRARAGRTELETAAPGGFKTTTAVKTPFCAPVEGKARRSPHGWRSDVGKWWAGRSGCINCGRNQP
eukprot:1514343-Rhodomonas_salina.2